MLKTREKRFRLVLLIALGYILTPSVFYGWLRFRMSTDVEADLNGFSFTVFFLLWVLAFPVVATICGLVELVGRVFHEKNYK